MGLYAALYYCGSVNFENGLLLVKRAWDAISDACLGGSYGMGMIIGLDEAEIRSWCDEQKDAWICNQNNPHTFIISGTLKSVSLILDKAKAEGALRTNLLPVSRPYHSKVLGKAKESLKDFLGTLRFDEPVYPYFSCLDNKMIVKGSGFREEVARNIDSHMNWLLTIDHLINLGTAVFFECGAGDGLTRNFRFIRGSYKAFSINNLQDFIAYLKAHQDSDDIPAELDLP
jgi:malonyl CoA-acyl carrier protein transacylase